MADFPYLTLLVRIVHFASAALAIGVPLYLRLVLLPAAGETLDPAARAALLPALNRRWRPLVHALITLFVLTGLYNFVFVVLPTPLGSYKPLYHMLFGFKILLALAIFFLASVLPGRSPAFAFLRQNPKPWLLTLIILLLMTLTLSSTLRLTRDQVRPSPTLVRPAPQPTV